MVLDIIIHGYNYNRLKRKNQIKYYHNTITVAYIRLTFVWFKLYLRVTILNCMHEVIDKIDSKPKI